MHRETEGKERTQIPGSLPSAHQTTELLKQSAYHNSKLSFRCSCKCLPSPQEKPVLRLPTFRKSIQTKKPALRLRKGTPRVFSSSVTYVWAAFRRARLALRQTWLIQSGQKKEIKKTNHKLRKNSHLSEFPKHAQCFFHFTLHLLYLVLSSSNSKKRGKNYLAVSSLCRRASS